MKFETDPTPEQLRTLPTADLAVVLLKSFRDQPNLNSILRGHEQAHTRNSEPDVDALLERVADAWAWLVAYGLISPHHRNTDGGWYRVTDRGQQVAAAGSVQELFAEQRLPEDLHSELSEARAQFRAGNAEMAVFAAMRQVDDCLKAALGIA